MIPFIDRLWLLFMMAVMFNPHHVVAQPGPLEPPASKPDPNLEKVRQLLNGFQFKDEQTRPLFEMGEAAFPIFESILKDPKSESMHVRRVMSLLASMKTDRRRFVEPAVARLLDADEGVRWRAVQLLGEIGSEHDTAPIVAMLSDKETVVHHAAAESLAKIGGKRDLVAMDAWLKTGSGEHRDLESMRHVKECRDKLEKRLKENPIPKDLKN